MGNPLDLEPIHMFSDPYSEEPGIQFFTETNEMLPKLSEGHHEKWIDRVVLTEDERNVYELLVEGSDNDGVEDFYAGVFVFLRERSCNREINAHQLFPRNFIIFHPHAPDIYPVFP